MTPRAPTASPRRMCSVEKRRERRGAFPREDKREGPSLSREEKREERGLPLVETREEKREERGLPLVEKREEKREARGLPKRREERRASP